MILCEQHGKDEISDARTIWHDERAQHGAVEASVAHRLQSPDHQKRRGDENGEKSPRRPCAGAFDLMQPRIQAAELTSLSTQCQAGLLVASYCTTEFVKAWMAASRSEPSDNEFSQFAAA